MSSDDSYKVTIPVLTGKGNYQSWKTRIQDVLTDKDLIDYADGTIKKPAVGQTKSIITTPARRRTGELDIDSEEREEGTSTIVYSDEDLASWKKSDSKALTFIRLRVDDNVLRHVATCTTSHEIFKQLEKLFDSTSTLSLFALKRQYYRADYIDGTNMSEHIAKLRSIHNQIMAIKDNGMKDYEFATALIMSLGESWQPLIQSINLDYKNTTLFATPEDWASQVEQRIIFEANRRSKNKNGDDTALYVNRKNSGYKGKRRFNNNTNNSASGSNENYRNKTHNNSGNNNKNDDKKPGNCNYCHKPNHWERECCKRIRDEAKGKKRENANATKDDYSPSGFAVIKSTSSSSSTPPHKSASRRSLQGARSGTSPWRLGNSASSHGEHGHLSDQGTKGKSSVRSRATRHPLVSPSAIAQTIR